jgi:hypothetical protein
VLDQALTAHARWRSAGIDARSRVRAPSGRDARATRGLRGRPRR